MDPSGPERAGRVLQIYAVGGRLGCFHMFSYVFTSPGRSGIALDHLKASKTDETMAWRR